ERFELLGRERHGFGLDRCTIELLLQLLERTRRLLLERSRAIDHHDLGRLEATRERAGKNCGGETDSSHSVSFSSGPSSIGASILSTIGPIGMPRSSPMLTNCARPPSSR